MKISSMDSVHLKWDIRTKRQLIISRLLQLKLKLFKSFKPNYKILISILINLKINNSLWICLISLPPKHLNKPIKFMKWKDKIKININWLICRNLPNKHSQIKRFTKLRMYIKIKPQGEIKKKEMSLRKDC